MKTVEIVADDNFYFHKLINKSGSGIRLELFRKKEDTVPCAMIVFHQDKYVHKGDLEKACKGLEIKVDDFLKLIDSL